MYPTMMPLSPPYDSSAGGSLAASSPSAHSSDDEDGGPMDVDPVVVVKQEPIESYTSTTTTTSYQSQPIDQQLLPQDPFAALGLTAEQKQQVIQQLLASLTSSAGGVANNGNLNNVGLAGAVKPSAVMSAPASSTRDSRRDSTNATASSSTSRLRTMSPTPSVISPTSATSKGKGKSKASSSSTTSVRGPSQSAPRASSATPSASSSSRHPLPLDEAALVDAPLPPLPPLFGGLKGKGGKKGGGMSSVVIAEGEEIEEDDIWRPTVSFVLSFFFGDSFPSSTTRSDPERGSASSGRRVQEPLVKGETTATQQAVRSSVPKPSKGLHL
jgi:hypothetical protein